MFIPFNRDSYFPHRMMQAVSGRVFQLCVSLQNHQFSVREDAHG